MENLQPNYLAEYYKNRANLSLESAFNLTEIESDEEIKRLKKEVRKAVELLDEKNEKLRKEYEKVFSDAFVSTNLKPIGEYDGRRASYTYDLDSGLAIEDYDREECIVVDLSDGLSGQFYMPLGYNYKLGSIIVGGYNYNIRQDKTKINIRLTSHYIVSFFESKIMRHFVGSTEMSDIDYYDWKINDALKKVKPQEFINTMFNVDYKGGLDFRELRERCIANKAFEIILKTCPDEIKDLMLRRTYEQALPVYKLLNVSQKVYDEVLKIEGGAKILVEISENLSSPKFSFLQGQELIDYIKECKHFKEDLAFNGIEVARYGRDNDICYQMMNYYDGWEVFGKYYTFRHFISYVFRQVIDQGFSSVYDFIEELRDYLRMCDADGIVPTLYSSYLKQTHDITSRNHKIKVNAESEQMFKSRYETFKPYTYNGYHIVCPKCSDDLKREGDILNHCVSSYIKRVIDNECTIIFLRKDKDTPLVTIEVRDGCIAQVHGAHNRKPNKDEIDVINRYAKLRELRTKYY